jgi:hypothetical protein
VLGDKVFAEGVDTVILERLVAHWANEDLKRRARYQTIKKWLAMAARSSGIVSDCAEL